MKFNPRNIPGFGLSDGEVLERMWSYLRRFSSMTKEMRPTHRIDVLSDALHYYGRKSAGNISMFIPSNLLAYSISTSINTGQLLTKRLCHAQKMGDEAAQKLKDLIQESPGSEMKDCMQVLLLHVANLCCTLQFLLQKKM